MKEREENPKIPKPFEPHPNLDDRLNDAIAESEMQGGLDLNKLSVGSKAEVILEGGRYLIEKRDDGYYVSGDPNVCPEPTKVVWIGSIWGESTSFKPNFVGRGMNLQFRLSWQKNEVVEGTDKISQPFFITSRIEDVREFSGPDDESVLREYERELSDSSSDENE